MLKENKYTRKADGKSNEYTCNNYVIILNGVQSGN